MLIPQALAYSSLSLVPPQYGLYSSSIPLLVYGLLANSRHLATGPAAIIALLVSQRLKFYESEEDRIKISIMMAFATGLVRCSSFILNNTR